MSDGPASAPARINLLLVDDHQMVIEGIKTLLKTDPVVRVVAQANSGDEALRRLREHPEVQLAIVDLNMPQMSGVELTKRIRADFPSIRVMALSMFHDHSSVMEVLEAGGAGYLLKNTTKAELSEAIRAVAAGRTHFSQEVGHTLLQNLDVPGQRGPHPGPARGAHHPRKGNPPAGSRREVQPRDFLSPELPERCRDAYLRLPPERLSERVETQHFASPGPRRSGVVPESRSTTRRKMLRLYGRSGIVLAGDASMRLYIVLVSFWRETTASAAFSCGCPNAFRPR
jgi:DNA-binding NarL/FixJ family response regulator